MAPPPPDSGSLLRISGHAAAWPLLDAPMARRHEAEARRANPPGTLMARAGLAAARLALALAPRGRRAVVVCGPGDNGGDGLVAARHLRQAGWTVHLHRVARGKAPSADTAAALQAAVAAGLEPLPCPARLPEADLVIDALLGLGSQRAPDGEIAQAIAAIRASAAPVLAVDLPSGLHPDTGAVLGERAVVAVATLCPLSLRPGCFTHQGRDHAGAVWLADLGHPAADGSAWLGGAGTWPARPHASHKGRFGGVVVVGGDAGMAGALALAAEAALAAGAGRVFVAPLDEASAAPLRPELMRRPLPWAAQPAVLAQATVVAGVGG
ncbi:MAG: NAD(P)H-hydrate epimerase, partial [Burkholderiaceae bacterium]|nr:NAD(P)H-hydrate epimerase [Burkholderiaceae bacterium]